MIVRVGLVLLPLQCLGGYRQDKLPPRNFLSVFVFVFVFVLVFVSAQRLVCWSYCLCSGSGDNGRIDSASSVIFQRATSLHVEKKFRVNLDSEI